jgi:hypothetical protein
VFAARGVLITCPCLLFTRPPSVFAQRTHHATHYVFCTRHPERDYLSVPNYALFVIAPYKFTHPPTASIRVESEGKVQQKQAAGLWLKSNELEQMLAFVTWVYHLCTAQLMLGHPRPLESPGKQIHMTTQVPSNNASSQTYPVHARIKLTTNDTQSL